MKRSSSSRTRKTPPGRRPVRPKDLFRKLDDTLETIERSDSLAHDLSRTVQRLVDDYRSDLGLEGARIYRRDGADLVLEFEYPVEGRGHRGFRIPMSYAPIQELLKRGFVLLDDTDPRVDPRIESAIGVRHFAAITLGDRADYVIAFTVSEGSDTDHIVFTLNTIRHVIRLKFRGGRLEDRVEETRQIQMSLLPRQTPTFHDFDLWGETRPTEEVGGDLYDYLEVSDRVLGVAIADSAGHGLPAALQARDAIIGLRMGVEERMRITATIEKLNRVVARSALVTKFISLFYGELEPNGNFAYCNAGHPPPLVLHDGRFTELTTGGLLLGPHPGARYSRGFATLAPGDVVLLYTDGITEASDHRGEMLGVEGVREILASRTWTRARDLVEAVFDAVERFSAEGTPRDDRTVVAIVRRGPATDVS